MFIPNLFELIKSRDKDLSKSQILKDVIAGIIVGIIALPLSIALAISSGVSPEKGLITAVIAGFFISFLGGSRVQIGGPTGAFVIIVYGIINQHGIEGLTIATIMAGIILVIFGLLKFGSFIKFIPYPIITGFTSGIAIVLLSTQVKDFFGLKITEVPSEFILKWASYIRNFNTIDISATLIGLLCIVIMILWPKVNKTIPGSLIALLISTAAVSIFSLPVETIGSRFGNISLDISLPNFSNINLQTINSLFQPAITIAVLAGIESLLSAVVADGMIGKKHNSNVELIAQGLANIFSALFGGIPATGAIARTAANVKNGGRTPIAGIVHAVFILIIMLFLMPYVSLIPMASLAAILVIVSYNMGEWKAFKAIFKSSKSDISILIAAFVLTVFFDLVFAIELGMILAMALFMKKMSDTTNAFEVSEKLENVDEDAEDHIKKMDGEKLVVYEISGPLFFGAANTFSYVQNCIDRDIDILILRMKQVPFLDATAFNVLKQMDLYCRKHHIMLIFSEVQKKPYNFLKKIGYVSTIGEYRFIDNFEDSVKLAHEVLDIKFKIKALR